MDKFFKLPFDKSVGGAIGFIVLVIVIVAVARRLPVVKRAVA